MLLLIIFNVLLLLIEKASAITKYINSSSALSGNGDSINTAYKTLNEALEINDKPLEIILLASKNLYLINKNFTFSQSISITSQGVDKQTVAFDALVGGLTFTKGAVIRNVKIITNPAEAVNTIFSSNLISISVSDSDQNGYEYLFNVKIY